MKLSYRGVRYKSSNIPAPKPQPPITIRYHGNTYLIEPGQEPVKTSASVAAHSLSYRGTTYLVDGSVQPDVKGVFPKLELVW